MSTKINDHLLEHHENQLLNVLFMSDERDSSYHKIK